MFRKNIYISLVLIFQIIADQHSFVIIVPSYNNINWYKKNIDSVMCQNYSNYRVIFIDDASTDGTGKAVHDYLEKYYADSEWSLIVNESNQGALYNYYTAIHSCENREIILTVDGDDWLAHSEVLKKLDEEYSNSDIWITYGQYQRSNQKKGSCRQYKNCIIKNNSYRENHWYASHLRTFYAGLFKRIPLKSLLYKGNFFEMTWDVAFMIPMLEMAGIRHKYIDDILYIYNVDNQISDHKKNGNKQMYFHYFLAGGRKFPILDSLDLTNKYFNYTLSFLYLPDKESSIKINSGKVKTSYFDEFSLFQYKRVVWDKLVYAPFTNHRKPKNILLSENIRTKTMRSRHTCYSCNSKFRKEILDSFMESTSDYVFICDEKIVDMCEDKFIAIIDKMKSTRVPVVLFIDGAKNISIITSSLLDTVANLKFNIISIYGVAKELNLFRKNISLLLERSDLINIIKSSPFLYDTYSLIAAIEEFYSKDEVILLLETGEEEE